MERKHVNTILLAANACLAGALLTAWMSSPSAVVSEAAAQSRTTPPRTTKDFPNAAQQRAEIVKELKQLKTAVDQMRSQVDSGVKVRITNAEEIARAVQP